MSVDRSLLDQLIAEPTADRFSVYADALQTAGDPRGELIALEAHARATGTPRDPKAAAIEQFLGAGLLDQLGVLPSGGATLRWENGFVSDLLVISALVPRIKERNWLANDAFAMLRSLRIHDTTARLDDVQPIELALALPTLRRLAIGSPRLQLMPAHSLTRLLSGLPELTAIELRSASMLDEDRLLELERCHRLEAIALWSPANDAYLARVLAGSWPRLRSLAINSNVGSGGRRPYPDCLNPVLDGTQHPELADLAITSSGYEQALIVELPRRKLGKRLRSLGLNWKAVDDDTLEEVRDAFANIELTWPRPAGVTPTADDEYQLSRRLRVGLGRARAALPHAVRACQLDSHNYFHWVEAGYVHEALDQLPEKLEAMAKAIEISPDRWGGWAGRGAALRALGRYPEAREAYEGGLARDSKRLTLHYGLALVHHCEGDVASAIASLEACVEHSTTDANRAWYTGSIAYALLEEDRPAEAATYLYSARELAPNDVRLARFTGFERLAMGAPAEALAIATEIAGRAGGEGELFVHALRAAALRELARPDEAAALYRQLIAESDCPAWIAFAWLGLTLVGHEPFAPVATVTDPLLLADAIATHVNASREAPHVHDTADRCNDRINVAVAALGAAAIGGRHDELRARHAALVAYLAGPAPVKNIDWWLELGELMRAAAQRTPEARELLAGGYAVATGRASAR